MVGRPPVNKLLTNFARIAPNIIANNIGNQVMCDVPIVVHTFTDIFCGSLLTFFVDLCCLFHVSLED